MGDVMATRKMSSDSNKDKAKKYGQLKRGAIDTTVRYNVDSKTGKTRAGSGREYTTHSAGYSKSGDRGSLVAGTPKGEKAAGRIKSQTMQGGRYRTTSSDALVSPRVVKSKGKSSGYQSQKSAKIKKK